MLTVVRVAVWQTHGRATALYCEFSPRFRCESPFATVAKVAWLRRRAPPKRMHDAALPGLMGVVRLTTVSRSVTPVSWHSAGARRALPILQVSR
jgi:hypothetical protein